MKKVEIRNRFRFPVPYMARRLTVNNVVKMRYSKLMGHETSMNQVPNLTYGTPRFMPSAMMASCNPKIEVARTKTVGIAIIISVNAILVL